MLIVWESWTQRSWMGDVKESKVSHAVLSGQLPDFSIMPPFLAAVVRYGLLQDDGKRPEAAEIFEFFHQEVRARFTRALTYNDSPSPFV